MSESRPIRFPSFPKPAGQVVLWEGPGKPTEEGIRERLAAQGYGVVRWTNEPATGYQPHAHIYPETMWVLSGSLTVILPADGRLLELLPGDRIEVPPGILHGAMAGTEGATYLLATR